MGFFSFVVVLCSSALLYMTRVFQGSSVFVPLFWFVDKIAFYRSKKKKIDGQIRECALNQSQSSPF